MRTYEDLTDPHPCPRGMYVCTNDKFNLKSFFGDLGGKDLDNRIHTI